MPLKWILNMMSADRRCLAPSRRAKFALASRFTAQASHSSSPSTRKCKFIRGRATTLILFKATTKAWPSEPESKRFHFSFSISGILLRHICLFVFFNSPPSRFHHVVPMNFLVLIGQNISWFNCSWRCWNSISSACIHLKWTSSRNEEISLSNQLKMC